MVALKSGLINALIKTEKPLSDAELAIITGADKLLTGVFREHQGHNRAY